MPPLRTATVSDWLTTSPGVFVLVAVLALLLSAVGPVLSRLIDSLEDSVRSRWGRAADQPGPRGIRLVVDDPGRRHPPADVDA